MPIKIKLTKDENGNIKDIVLNPTTMTVKSQDDLNKPETHSTEVLLSTIEELEKVKKENLLLKIANAELRDQLDAIYTRLEKAFYDDSTSFWDALVDIRKTIKKDAQNEDEC